MRDGDAPRRLVRTSVRHKRTDTIGICCISYFDEFGQLRKYHATEGFNNYAKENVDIADPGARAARELAAFVCGRSSM